MQQLAAAVAANDTRRALELTGQIKAKLEGNFEESTGQDLESHPLRVITAIRCGRRRSCPASGPADPGSRSLASFDKALDTFMSPREVFRDALLQGAGAIVIAHNHPSGDAEPSRDDQRITRRLGQAGEILGIEVLDHIVIGHQRWVSLARRCALLERGALTDFRDNRSEAVTRGRALGR